MQAVMTLKLITTLLPTISRARLLMEMVEDLLGHHAGIDIVA